MVELQIVLVEVAELDEVWDNAPFLWVYKKDGFLTFIEAFFDAIAIYRI